jgi:hypothetical protein
VVLLLLPTPGAALLEPWPVLRAELQDFGHPVIFAILALIGRTALARRSGGHLLPGHVLLLALGLGLFGAVMEVAQVYAGREGSWSDLLGNVLGIGLGLLLPVRTTAARSGAALLALLAAAPLLWTLSAYAWRHSQLPLVWRADSALLGRFAQWQGGEYPGLVLLEVPRDWRDFSALRVTVANPAQVPGDFAVRIHDAAHDQRFDDRFHRAFQAAPGTTEDFEIPLEEVRRAPVGRHLDLSRVASVIVFQQASRQVPRVMVLEVSLVP